MAASTFKKTRVRIISHIYKNKPSVIRRIQPPYIPHELTQTPPKAQSLNKRTCNQAHLKIQSRTSGSNNRSLNRTGVDQGEVVRRLGKGPDERRVRTGTKVVSSGHSVSSIGGVKGALGADEDVVLNQKLGAQACVDAVIDVVVVARFSQYSSEGDIMGSSLVPDVAGTETEAGAARVDVLEQVESVRDAEVTGVLGRVGVRVANQGRLPVVVQERVRNGGIIDGVGQIQQAIIVVLVVVEVRAKVYVVNPDVGAQVDADCVARARKHLLDGKVADDDVLGRLDDDAHAVQDYGAGRAENRLVGSDLDRLGTREGSGDDDDGCSRLGGSSLECIKGRDLDGFSACTSGGSLKICQFIPDL